MSSSTDEFAALIRELSSEFGEGLLATFYESASSNINPDANLPGAPSSITFDPATQSYDDTAAQAAGGEAEAVTVAVPPPRKPNRATLVDGQGTLQGDAVLTVPPILRADGTRLFPRVGMRVKLHDRFWQVLRVDDIAAGDGISGHDVTLQGGGI